MKRYQDQYEVVFRAPKKNILQGIFRKGDIPSESYDYLMVTYSQLKDARRDMTRLDFLRLLCEKNRVLFIFDEAHRSSSVSTGKISAAALRVSFRHFRQTSRKPHYFHEPYGLGCIGNRRYSRKGIA